MVLLASLGLILAALALWVLWLLVDGVIAMVGRHRIGVRNKLARMPMKLVVAMRQDHTPDLFSLTVSRPDGKRLPVFSPGQYLTVNIPGGISRCYSLAAWEKYPREYRLGIRRVEDGRVSAWLHKYAQPGVEIEVLPPVGEFVLKEGAGDVVLVAGGIGLTPMAAMVDAMRQRGGKRQVWLFHAVRTFDDLVGFERYTELGRTRSWFHYRPYLTCPPTDWAGGIGRLNSGILVRELIDRTATQFYLCARQKMMDELAQGLVALGAQPEAVHWESFGSMVANQDMTEYRVSIAGRGCCAFQGQPSLLHALESWGVPIGADCRSGTCGACRIGVGEGKTKLRQPQGVDVPSGYVLACCAVPETDLEISV